MKPLHWRVSTRVLLIGVLLVMLVLNIIIAQVLQRIQVQRRSGAAEQALTPEEIEQCKKLGVNSAVNLDDFSAGQVALSGEIGMRWYEGLLSTDNFDNAAVTQKIIDQINTLQETVIEDPTQSPTSTPSDTTSPTPSPTPTPGIHVVLRIVAPSPTLVGDEAPAEISSSKVAEVVNKIANGVKDKTQPIYFIAGHNEPNCSEWVPPAEEVAYSNSLTSKITASNIVFVSPMLDPQCGYPKTASESEPLYAKLKEYGIPKSKWPTPGYSLSAYLDAISAILNNSKIKYVSLSAYNSDNLSATDTVNSFKSLGKTDKPLIIAETGMFDQNVSRLSQTLKTFQQDDQIKAILIFNAFGFNPNFPYHQKLRCDLNQFANGLSKCFNTVTNPKRYNCTVQPIPSTTATPTSSTTASPTPTPTATPTPTPTEIRLPDTKGTFSCTELTVQGGLTYNQNEQTLITKASPDVTIPQDGGAISTAVTVSALDNGQTLSNQGIIINVLGTNFAAYSSDEGGNPSQVVVSNIKENFTYSVYIELLDKDNKRCELKGSFVYKQSTSSPTPSGGTTPTPSGEVTPTPINDPGPDTENPPAESIATVYSYTQFPYINRITVVEGIPAAVAIIPDLASKPVSKITILSKPDWLSNQDGVLIGTPPQVDKDTETKVEFTYQQGGKLYRGTTIITILDNQNKYLPVRITYQLQGVKGAKQAHPLISLNWLQSGNSVFNIYAAGNNQGEIRSYFDSTKSADTLQVNPLNYLQKPITITDISSLLSTVDGQNTISMELPSALIFGDFDKTGASLDKITTSDYSLFLKYYRQNGPAAEVNRDNHLWAEDRGFMSINFGKTSSD